ncbi:MAG: hypothetical protein GY898_33115 [Proteobacteria bacterium]|nr:hypothetical protein [Pseudomonadota bacterium]
MSDERLTTRWWHLLIGISVLNVALLASTAAVVDFDDPYVLRQFCLTAVFTSVCAFRSVLPRIDLERYCLVDSPLSSMVAGRSAATVAEISFATQVALVIHLIGGAAGISWVQALAVPIVVLLTVAQMFCWSSVISLNHLGHAIEESLWAITFAGVGVALAASVPHLDGTLKTVSLIGAVCSAGYVAFMVTVDVPMYVKRWRSGQAEGVETLGLKAGLGDALGRRVVTRDWAIWKPEVAWLTGYFSAGVWLSQAMVHLPHGA